MGDLATEKPSFFACYLLCSLNSRFKGRTYIGFTVNPKRRIRQHNGEITSGARKTQKRRPWEMILCVYGFPSHVHALQFEWAWQHPLKSLAVRNAAKDLKRRGVHGQVLLLFTMLNLPEWNSMNLVVNILSTKHQPLTKGCPSLPLHMLVKVGPLDDLPCYSFPYYGSADECEFEDMEEADGNSTEDSDLRHQPDEVNVTLQSKVLQGGDLCHQADGVDGTRRHKVLEGGDRNAVLEQENLHNVLAAIKNTAAHALHAAPKPKKQSFARKAKPKEFDKDAQTSNKSDTVVSPSKKRGRPKSRKKESVSKEGLSEYDSSLLAKTHGLHLEEVGVVTDLPSTPRLEMNSVYDEHVSSPCLPSFSTWDVYTDFPPPTPYSASPLLGGKQGAHAESSDTSPCLTTTVSTSVPNNADTLVIEESQKFSTPCQTPSTMVSISVPHNADTLFIEESPKSSTPCRTPSAFSEDRAEISPTHQHVKSVVKTSAVWDISQFTPLWSPSPLLANGSEDGVENKRNVEALPFKLTEECGKKMNNAITFTPLSPLWPCSPMLNASGAGASTMKLGYSQVISEGGLSTKLFHDVPPVHAQWSQSSPCGNNVSIQGVSHCNPINCSVTPAKRQPLEVIDLTDSPTPDAYSIKKFTIV